MVSVTTTDGLLLHGLLTEPMEPSRWIIIHVHGAAGSFYGNSYFERLATTVTELGIAYLSTNNRGSGVYELEWGTVYHGVSLEIFEDCILDIDAWVELALDRGYEDIILEGHSYGTEKSVYYMGKGRHRARIKGLILFGFSDNVGCQLKYEERIGKRYVDEAVDLVRRGEGHHLLGDLFGLCGELPISAQTYLNCFSEGSESSTALPLRRGRDLTLFRNISVPILGVIGDKEEREYTVIPIREAIDLLSAENALAEVYQIADCGHGFAGREAELAAIVREFISRRILP